MKRTIITGLLVTVFLLVSACSSHRYTVVEPKKKELTEYRVLEIRDFKSNLVDSESKELAARFCRQTSSEHYEGSTGASR